ncbi:MAG TPA: DUF4258 domain-containing protein [Kofleriaceae bacterium]|nr:DUF4258 domain-containing protein [Kofleriaceae bacterium]
MMSRHEGAAPAGDGEEAHRRDPTLSFSKHAYEEMAKDDLTEVDVRNTLRAGVARPGELEKGSWRYRVETSRLVAVIAFRSETHAVVVTAWRLRN